MNSKDEQFLQWFRLVTPYIHAHRGKTFVIMLPGDCISHADAAGLIHDISILHALGIRLIIVHGTRTQIEEELGSAGISSSFHQGARITERDHLVHILKAVGRTRWQLEALFSSGLPNSPMYGAKIKIRGGNFITAMPQGVIDGVDHQMTGKVRSVDGCGIKDVLDKHNIALLSPIGYSVTGEVFNLSFADIGIAVANEIEADKVIIYNDDGPIYDRQGKLYRQLTLDQCRQFLEIGEQHAPANSYFSLRAGYVACRNGAARAHIISSAEDGTLLRELFTRDGVGTMIHSDSYELARQATIEDVAGIVNLISPLEQEGVLVKRSRELLENEISQFTVLEKDSHIIACGALYPIAGSTCGELACLAVLEDYRKGGRARKLLDHLEAEAARLGLDRLFTLTTVTSHWFIEHGFREVQVESLPAKRQELYNFQRNSKVMEKVLKQE